MPLKVAALKRSGTRLRAVSPRQGALAITVHGMSDLPALIAAGYVRGEIRLPPESPGAVPIELAADEEIIARSPLLGTEDMSELVISDDPQRPPCHPDGIEVVFIAKRAALPRLRIGADDPRVAELARLLTREAVRP